MKLRLTILAIWTAILLAVLFAPVSQIRFVSVWPFAREDKIVHIILFFITVILIIFCTKSFWTFRTRIITGIISGVILGAATELIQGLIPVRSMSIFDFFADVGGLSLGIFLYLMLYRIKIIRRFI